MELPRDVMKLHRSSGFARSYGSVVLEHTADEVWAMIRDFNGYPAYIEGVTESHLEDDKAGDEVGAVRRFVYNGASIRQTLTGHSDAARWFTHAGCEPLEWPGADGAVGPATYENAIHVHPVTDGDRAFVEWWLDFIADDSQDLARWKRYFDDSLPVWFGSLRRHLDAEYPPGRRPGAVLVTGLTLKPGVQPEEYERFAREVDKPTCERDLPSIAEWHVHRVEQPGDGGAPPFDYVEVVRLADTEQFARDLESETAAALGAQLSRLVEEPTLLVGRPVA